MLKVRLEVNPVPASRPRVSKWGTYYGKRHQAMRSEAVALLSSMREQGFLPAKPMSGSLRVWVAFAVKRPKTSKLNTPRGDIDNYLKILLDCCNGIVWEDDIQIENICAHKDFADDEGFIDLWVEEKTNDTNGLVRRKDEEGVTGTAHPESFGDGGFDFSAGCFTSVPDLPAGGSD